MKTLISGNYSPMISSCKMQHGNPDTNNPEIETNAYWILEYFFVDTKRGGDPGHVSATHCTIELTRSFALIPRSHISCTFHHCHSALGATMFREPQRLLDDKCTPQKKLPFSGSASIA
jgi:hypothetical protein